VEALGRKLKGHFGYYGIRGNYEALARYRLEVIRVWRKWLARRGDPQGMSWERMTRLLPFYYLPPARIVHSVFAAKPSLEEPYAGNPLVRVCGGVGA
jgi:hypothetical protein